MAISSAHCTQFLTRQSARSDRNSIPGSLITPFHKYGHVFDGLELGAPFVLQDLFPTIPGLASLQIPNSRVALKSRGTRDRFASLGMVPEKISESGSGYPQLKAGYAVVFMKAVLWVDHSIR